MRISYFGEMKLKKNTTLLLFLSFYWDKIGFSFHRWFWNAPYAESVKERLAKFMFGYVLVKIMVIIGCIAIIFLLTIETGIQIQFENWEKKSNMGVCVQYVVYAHTPRYFAKHIKFSVLLLSKRTWICERKLMIRFLLFVFARFIFFRLFVYYKWF